MKFLYIISLPFGDISAVVLVASLTLSSLGTILGFIAGVVAYIFRRDKPRQKNKTIEIIINNVDGSQRKIFINDVAEAEKILGEIKSQENLSS